LIQKTTQFFLGPNRALKKICGPNFAFIFWGLGRRPLRLTSDTTLCVGNLLEYFNYVDCKISLIYFVLEWLLLVFNIVDIVGQP